MPETIKSHEPQFLTLNPLQLTHDVSQTVQYYAETLGFGKDWDLGDPIFYVSASRDGITFHFRHVDTLPVPANRATDIIDVYVTVTDLDQLYSELVTRGAKIIYGPVQQEYGMKEFYVEDCNGYRLGFGQQI